MRPPDDSARTTAAIRAVRGAHHVIVMSWVPSGVSHRSFSRSFASSHRFESCLCESTVTDSKFGLGRRSAGLLLGRSGVVHRDAASLRRIAIAFPAMKPTRELCDRHVAETHGGSGRRYPGASTPESEECLCCRRLRVGRPTNAPAISSVPGAGHERVTCACVDVPCHAPDSIAGRRSLARPIVRIVTRRRFVLRRGKGHIHRIRHNGRLRTRCAWRGSEVPDASSATCPLVMP